MRIMQIDVNYKYSSTGKIVSDLHEQLIAHQHQSFVAYGRGKKIKAPNVYKFGLDLETNVHALLTRLTGLTGVYSPFSTFRLIQKIKKFKPDVIHIHELHAYFVNHARVMKYIKKHKIPTIWTFHCEYMYTGKCGHAHDCTKFMTECHHCPQKKEYPKSLVFDFTKHMFRVKKSLFENFQPLTIVTPSNWLKTRVEMSFLSNYPVSVIHNGIDTEHVYFPKDVAHLKGKYQFNEDTLIIVSVAPNIMSPQKGGQLIFKLAEKLSDFNVHFIMIGAESNDMVTPNNVTLLEKIYDQQLISEYYNLADVSLLFSQRENFPITAIESLSCGTPLLAFDTGGTQETASHGFGTFIKYGDLKKAEELIRTHQITKKTDDMKESCARIYRELYSKHTMFKNYEKIYMTYVDQTI